MDCAAPPAVKLALEGLACTVKSGVGGAGVVPAAFTASAIDAVRVNVPEVPVTTTVALPVAADAPATKLTC
jgi:hypothetical protein